jgi:hypothetical protein
MTHRELVTVPREFNSHETQFFYLFIKTLSCHQKCICGRLLNANETPVKLPLRLTLDTKFFVCLGCWAKDDVCETSIGEPSLSKISIGESDGNEEKGPTINKHQSRQE